MADDANKPQGDPEPQGDPKEEGKKSGGDELETFTQEDVNKIVSKKVNELNEKFDSKLEQTLEKKRQEWEKQSKMSEEERAKELSEKQKQELEKRDRELTLRENKIDAQSKLGEAGIPIKFADYLTVVVKEKQDERIDQFTELWNKAVKDGIAKELEGGDPPKDPSGKSKNSSDGAIKTTF